MDDQTADARPYHHGDLRRALIEAAHRLLEAEGPAALSLRAVAREAGVSPAAPYHHFKDKRELLEAVADEGWVLLGQAVFAAGNAAPRGDSITPGVLAYIRFARERPALYRVMYDTARLRDYLPIESREGENSPAAQIREALTGQGDDVTELDIELALAAVWCAAHGVAEMAGFRQFESLKAQLGGELPFLEAVLRHMGVYRPARKG